LPKSDSARCLIMCVIALRMQMPRQSKNGSTELSMPLI